VQGNQRPDGQGTDHDESPEAAVGPTPLVALLFGRLGWNVGSERSTEESGGITGHGLGHAAGDLRELHQDFFPLFDRAQSASDPGRRRVADRIAPFGL
jgi:hypothetical protein